MLDKIKMSFYRKTLKPIQYAKKIGVQIGNDSRLVDLPDFGSEPYLITIGNHVLISFDVTFITHDASTFIFRNEKRYKNIYKFGPIEIKNNSFIGAKTIILPNVTIGNNCIIGAGSVVTKDIPDGQVWGGVPAKYITHTTDYAEKCLLNRLPYDEVLINTDKKNEMLKAIQKSREETE